MKIKRLLPLLAAVLLLAGCKDKLTAENYDRLKSGMSYAEAKAVLGDPTSCNDLLTVKNCTWGDDQRFINVSFVADKVVLTNAHNLH